ncbi:MAG: heme exporter protein CcmB [Jiangellaceae bacterium]
MSAVGATRQAGAVAVREVALELASRETAITVLPFVAALMLLGGLGLGPEPAALQAAAPGFTWVVVLVAALPLARGVAAAERACGSWDLLRALIAPVALLAGKLLALWLALLACWALASVLAAVLLGAMWPLAAVAGGLLGTLGIAATTVVLGVLLPDGGRRPGLLAVLLLPGAVPVLLAGTQTATAGVAAGPWLALLSVYDAVSLAAAWAIFPTLLEE